MTVERCKRCNEPFYTGNTYSISRDYCNKCISERKEIRDTAIKDFIASTKRDTDCPVCNGNKRIHGLKCDRCRGKGYITVSDTPYNASYDFRNNEPGLIDNMKKNLPSDYEEKGGCFITTACLSEKDLGDKCDQLQRLRHFRDNYLVRQSRGKRDIYEYYLIAPKIVKAINKEKNKNAIYEQIYKQDILNALRNIEDGNNEAAYAHYKSMVERLTAQFL